MPMLRMAGMKLLVYGISVSAWWRSFRCFAAKTGGVSVSEREEGGEAAKNSLKDGKVGGAASSTTGKPR